ncbi:MAG: hypothetical protein NC338_04590 [Firmicutes bacterium]|nr:hypothetical protein [Bacillota bacterium]MCM1401151.1 hypothetical protein [Bacteroides sp.]MCM1477026.1 hypothetical protein [Bacteroides sp.]
MKDQDLDLTSDPTSWKGYDIDQLRYRRAYLLARCEIERMKLTSKASSLKQGIPTFKTSGIASRLLKGLSYMDYAYLAYKVVSKVMKISGKVRKK